MKQLNNTSTDEVTNEGKPTQKPLKECFVMVRKWFQNSLIRNTIILSTIFALIIHTLFSVAAPCDFLVGKWGAGDILTYVCTITLGLLAVWQNQKFKEESDRAQTRMENLANKANELSVVSKVIEHESKRISLLKTKTQDFINACNTEGLSEDISDVANQPNDFMKTYVKLKMDSRGKRIKLCAIELLTELQTYPNDSKAVELIKYISEYSGCSVALVKDVRVLSIDEERFAKKAGVEQIFITSVYGFIAERELLLNKVIYGNLSLEQIRSMCNTEKQT